MVKSTEQMLDMKTNISILLVVQGDLVMNKQVEHEVNGAEMGGTSIIVEQLNEKSFEQLKDRLLKATERWK